MSPRPASRSVKGPIRLYVVIVALYVALMAWWVFFFSRQGDVLVARMEAAGAPLDPSQVDAVQRATGESLRMFVFETGFLGLLLIGSVYIVLRALRREILLARQQRNFLAAVTHELRSPLASARLYIDSILLGRTDADKQQRYLRHAREDLDRLTDMVEDILTTRRITEAGADVRAETVDLAELLASHGERLSGLYAPRGTELTVTTEGPVPVRVDPVALEQILDNLVSNAVKYADDGGRGARIDLAARREGRRAVLLVTDRGPGLGDVDPAQLLEPFVRGGDELVRTRPGAGLGLYIVRQLVEAMGGRIELADASPGPGLAVRIELPVPDAVAGSPSAAPTGVDVSAGARS